MYTVMCRLNSSYSRGAWLTVLTVAGPFNAYSQGMVLQDGSFESGVLLPIGQVLPDLNGNPGRWGTEASTITGPTGGITPAEGSLMLQVMQTGGVASQTLQAIDVTSFAALIDSGKAVVNFGAFYNTPFAGIPGVMGLHFYSGPSVGFWTSSYYQGVMLDTNLETWQLNAAQSAVPFGTRWLVFDVYYHNDFLQNGPSYVDAAYVSVVPEPGAAVGLCIGILFLAARQKLATK